MKRFLTPRVTRVLILLAIIALIGSPVAWAKRSSVFNQLELLVDIRHEIVSGYVTEPDQGKMVESAVRAMVESLNDPYTVYFSPEELEKFDKTIHGSFSGIGAEIEVVQKRLRVVSPLDGSPAWKAGILPGDLVLEIDGKSTAGIKDANEAVKLLVGEEGTAVKLKVRHESGAEVELNIVRGQVNIQTVKGFRRKKDNQWDYMVDSAHKIGYVRISTFSDNTAADTGAALKTLVAQGVKGVILDLRFNPGGLLESAVEISTMFLDKGKRIVSVKGRAVPEKITYATAEKIIPDDVAVVVLANESSASAAEIVTGALSDNQRAQFVGTRTFGKGSVQQVLQLENDQGALKLTNAHYYLPNGRNIHRREGSDTWGVDPNEGSYVPMTPDQIGQMLEIRRAGDSMLMPNAGESAVAVTPAVAARELADPQLAAGLAAILGKFSNGSWPPVGMSNAKALALASKHENLIRQRDFLKQKLVETEADLKKMDSPVAAAPATTQPE